MLCQVLHQTPFLPMKSFTKLKSYKIALDNKDLNTIYKRTIDLFIHFLKVK